MKYLILAIALITTNATAQTLVKNNTGFVFTYSESITFDGFDFKYVVANQYEMQLSKTVRSESFDDVREKALKLIQDSDVYQPFQVVQNKQSDNFKYEARVRVAKFKDE